MTTTNTVIGLPQIETTTPRKYFIDWLRIGLIISVFFFHVGMIFRPEQWHVNSTESFPFLEPIMSWLHLWRMPLLFLVSGIGTYYAIGRRTSWQYLKERFKRLFIPFIVGFFTLVPLMVYVERIDNYSSFWDFIPHMFDGGAYPVGNLSWHHLWFIVYLFTISLLITPFLNYTNSSHFNMLRGKLIVLATKKMGLNWLLLIIIGSQIVLRQYFPNSTHALYNDWAYFTFYLIFFLGGFILFTSDKVINTLAQQRRMYLVQAIVFTAILFSFWVFDFNIVGGREIYSITEMIIALSCGLTAIGYFKTYFNRDHRYRKALNEAIYPFYLLHQPALIFVGYVVLKWDISYLLQAIIITILSLVFISISYLCIKEFNVLRVAFGMKTKPQKEIMKSADFREELSLEKVKS